MGRLAAKLALMLGSFVVCFGVAELVARIWLPEPPHYRVPQPVHDLDPLLGYRLRPSQQAYTHGEPVHVNAAGMRDDDELPASKPDGELRVLVLGDSLTFGSGVPTSGTYSEVLERLLRERGYPVRALNAGVQNYDVHQEATFLGERGFALEPDAVVVGFYENDVRPHRDTYADVIAADGALRERGVRSLVPDSLVYLAKTLRIVAFARRRYFELQWAYFPPDVYREIHASLLRSESSPYAESTWRDVEASLARMAEDARAHGVPLVLAIFPFESQVRDPASSRDGYQTRLVRVAQRLGVEAIDLLDPLREVLDSGADPFIPYDGHPSAAAHEAAARALVEPVAAGLAARTRR
jgi:lysophospholipase L1-like esterase